MSVYSNMVIITLFRPVFTVNYCVCGYLLKPQLYTMVTLVFNSLERLDLFSKCSLHEL